MIIENAKWIDQEHAEISARIDGIDLYIPAVVGNRHYDAIIDSGIQIAEFVQPPPLVPTSVTPYQARMALLNAGLLDQVTTLMSDPATPKGAVIAWEYATSWERNSAFIATLAPILNLTDAQVDALFVAAAAL